MSRIVCRPGAVLLPALCRFTGPSAAFRPLSTTALFRHKESASDDPEHAVDKLKEKSIEQQKSGNGQWMSGLASDSEEAVKADRVWAERDDLIKEAKAGGGSGGEGKQPSKK